MLNGKTTVRNRPQSRLWSLALTRIEPKARLRWLQPLDHQCIGEDMFGNFVIAAARMVTDKIRPIIKLL
ncbi:hypothetical protein EBB04_22195 [Sinorhizobium meliloti]|nr:hypothetical protein EBB04_22195 [Sinorhizobium meliloti]